MSKKSVDEIIDSTGNLFTTAVINFPTKIVYGFYKVLFEPNSIPVVSRDPDENCSCYDDPKNNSPNFLRRTPS